MPLIATGGSSEASIRATVEAGANAVICTPPTNKELFSGMMKRYRESSDIHATTPANARGLSDASLREIEARLPAAFAKINRGAIGQLSRIERFVGTFAGGVDARFYGGHREYVSRRCLAELKRRMHL